MFCTLARTWPYLAVTFLGTLVLVRAFSPASPTLPSIAMLAGIEPAAGAAAPAEHGAPSADKKSFTGKNLTSNNELPVVTIGALPIQTAEQLNRQEQLSDLGELATQGQTNSLLKRAWRITPYAHNPTRGQEDAAVALIEFSDLSCAQCMPYLAKADAWLKEHKGTVRQTQIHSPVGNFQDINLAAFYGKIAQRGGTFWQYRDALITLEEPTPEKYFSTLLSTGIDRAMARRLLNTESRRLYRELDADASLARRLHIGEPPSFVVNTIMVGPQGLPLDSLGNVLTYQLNTYNRIQRLKPNDTVN